MKTDFCSVQSQRCFDRIFSAQFRLQQQQKIFRSMLLLHFWRSVILSLVLTLPFFFVIVVVAFVAAIVVVGLTLRQCLFDIKYFFFQFFLNFSTTVSRRKNSPAFEKSYDKPWSCRCHRCRLQCCYFGIFNSRSK